MPGLGMIGALFYHFLEGAFTLGWFALGFLLSRQSGAGVCRRYACTCLLPLVRKSFPGCFTYPKEGLILRIRRMCEAPREGAGEADQ